MDEKRHFGHSALEASHRAKVIMGRTVSGDILDLIDDAWAAPTRDERARLARSALKLDADALDGYLALSTSVETTIIHSISNEHGISMESRHLYLKCWKK